jgi:hypothetical protein
MGLPPRWRGHVVLGAKYFAAPLLAEGMEVQTRSHLAVLQRAGYVCHGERFKGKYLQTICGMTKKGSETLELYAQARKEVSKVMERAKETK